MDLSKIKSLREWDDFLIKEGIKLSAASYITIYGTIEPNLWVYIIPELNWKIDKFIESIFPKVVMFPFTGNIGVRAKYFPFLEKDILPIEEYLKLEYRNIREECIKEETLSPIEIEMFLNKVYKNP